MNIQVKHAIEFVKNNRKGDAFKNYEDTHVASLIVSGLDSNTALLATDDSENITGIVCATKYPNTKTLYVHEILTVKSWVLGAFLSYFSENFKGWQLEAMRKGKLVTYNVDKLLQKTLNKTK